MWWISAKKEIHLCSPFFSCRIWNLHDKTKTQQEGDSLEKRIRYLTLAFASQKRARFCFKIYADLKFVSFHWIKCIFWLAWSEKRRKTKVLLRKFEFTINFIAMSGKNFESTWKWQFNHSDRMECDFEKFLDSFA